MPTEDYNACKKTKEKEGTERKQEGPQGSGEKEGDFWEHGLLKLPKSGTLELRTYSTPAHRKLRRRGLCVTQKPSLGTCPATLHHQLHGQNKGN